MYGLPSGRDFGEWGKDWLFMDIPETDEWPKDWRFRPFKFGYMIAGNTVLYGINDTNYTSPNESIMRNWQKGKKTARVWKGTREDAIALCDLLNRDKTVKNRAVKEDTSVTQKRYYANEARKRAKPKASLSAFKTCICGVKYKGEKHCE